MGFLFVDSLRVSPVWLRRIDKIQPQDEFIRAALDVKTVAIVVLVNDVLAIREHHPLLPFRGEGVAAGEQQQGSE